MGKTCLSNYRIMCIYDYLFNLMLLTTVLLPDFFPGRLLKRLLYNETEVLVPRKGILWLILGQEGPDSLL